MDGRKLSPIVVPDSFTAISGAGFLGGIGGLYQNPFTIPITYEEMNWEFTTAGEDDGHLFDEL